MSKIKIILSVVVVIGILISAKGLLQKRKTEIANESLPNAASLTVTVVNPKEKVMQNRVSYLAQVVSDKSIKLSTKLAGYVEEVLVEEAQKVKKGETLVRIDNTELLSSLEALKVTLLTQIADAKIAKNIYMRNKKLYKVGGLAKEKLEISNVTLQMKNALYKSTEEKIVQLKHQSTYLNIVAPFDGEIDSISLHKGDLAVAGKAILSMSNGKKKLLFSYASQPNSVIKKEQDIFINEKQVGYIKSIYPTAQNGLVRAEISLSKVVTLPIGSFVNIEVLTKELKGCVVPNDTLLHKKEGTFVMRYVEGKFTPMRVDVQMQEGYNVLISPCPTSSVAKASEVKLAQLTAYKNVQTVKELKGVRDE